LIIDTGIDRLKPAACNLMPLSCHLIFNTQNILSNFDSFTKKLAAKFKGLYSGKNSFIFGSASLEKLNP
jgi:hypothetical protein